MGTQMALTDAKEQGLVYLNSIPEPGQLVEVRRRQWVVTDVRSSSLTKTGDSDHHLVELSSLEEDSIGEEIQVIWQLEPGARILERAGLPSITGWDGNDHLEAFLDAVRWGAVTNADRTFLQSPFRSGISIEDYQLDPLVRAVEMARVNLLIADDVGLGKTIEAGLVIQELLVRHRARTVFVICPASLQIKWQQEMQEKFGLEFRIVDTDYLKQLRRERGIHVNPWTSFPRLITSMDWIKSGEGYRFIKDVLSPYITYPRKFDILVVDEAHNISPAASSLYSIESLRTRVVRMLSPHFNHHLFLSATPHNGYQESFTSLLELLDDQRFARTVMPDEKQLHRVMVRRMKSDIVDADGKPVFPKRKLECLEIEYTDEERQIHSLLREFTSDRLLSVKGSRFEYGTHFVHILLKKRLFSSPLAFALTLAKHRETLERRKPQANRTTFDDKILHKAILKVEEDFSDDALAETAQHEAVQLASELSNPLSQHQKEMLVSLSTWADKERNRVDSKAKAILRWLAEHLKTDGQWNHKRVILFTEYRATHSWLQQILTTHGFGGNRLMYLHGSMAPDEREVVKAAFQASPEDSPVRILLATDAASEGIDLQNHCNYLIHVEIPWNPNVMEQRNGRIDRHGQKEDTVYIWHPVGINLNIAILQEETKPGNLDGDHEYLMRAVLKINAIREDLGSIGPIISQQIEEAMLGRRSSLDTASVEAKAAKARKLVTAEKRLQERIYRLHAKLIEAKQDFHLSPERIYRAVNIALSLAEKPPLKPIEDIRGLSGGLYEVPILTGSWGRATTGLEHPHTHKRRPITFDNGTAKGRDDVVVAHLNHPLVQMCLRLLREEIWKLDNVKRLNRIAIKTLPKSEISTPVVAVWSRLVITGGDHHRLHEEITLAGGELGDKFFNRISQVGRLDTLVQMGKPLEPSQRMFEYLKDLFLKHEEAILSTVQARSRDRLKFLENTLNRRMASEMDDINAVLHELQVSIQRELNLDVVDDQLYLPGFSPEEIAQVRKDVQALKSRLDRIPQEKDDEIATIMKHYANPVDRTFPVALVFFVPEEM